MYIQDLLLYTLLYFVDTVSSVMIKIKLPVLSPDIIEIEVTFIFQEFQKIIIMVI
jgi:hypothetical protein